MSGHVCGDCGCAVWKQSPVPEYPACPHDKRGPLGAVGPPGIPELMPWQKELLERIGSGQKMVLWMSPRPSYIDRVEMAAMQVALDGLAGNDREVRVIGRDQARSEQMAADIYKRAAEMLEWLHQR